MARIIVCGYMIRHPVAGNIMAYFQYILGLHRLGYQVAYVEESGWPSSCYDPIRKENGDDPSVGLKIVRQLMEYYRVDIPMCYFDRESGDIWGMDLAAMRRLMTDADLLLNVGGVCWLPDFLLCQCRALVDMDPFFTQIGCFSIEGVDEYQSYFSYGVNIGHAGCHIPTNGKDWLATVPPVVPDIWATKSPCINSGGNAPFTTVANWSAYGAVNYHNEQYGQKDLEFLRLVDLPGKTTQKLELALSGAGPEIIQQLELAGWSVRCAGELSKDISTYKTYITDSRGEFTAAKNAYVKTNSGWFSDRSVCYLAAGRPVIMQDTGFSTWLPTGEGVLAFSTLDEAMCCIEKVNSRYTNNCRTARKLAEQTFSYKNVLTAMLDTIWKRPTVHRRV